MNRPSSIEYLGNQDLLNCRKWGFMGSRTIPSDEVLRCYDWASKRAAAGDCVVSGFSSRMERDVLHFIRHIYGIFFERAVAPIRSRPLLFRFNGNHCALKKE